MTAVLASQISNRSLNVSSEISDTQDFMNESQLHFNDDNLTLFLVIVICGLELTAVRNFTTSDRVRYYYYKLHYDFRQQRTFIANQYNRKQLPLGSLITTITCQ